MLALADVHRIRCRIQFSQVGHAVDHRAIDGDDQLVAASLGMKGAALVSEELDDVALAEVEPGNDVGGSGIVEPEEVGAAVAGVWSESGGSGGSGGRPAPMPGTILLFAIVQVGSGLSVGNQLLPLALGLLVGDVAGDADAGRIRRGPG